MLDMNFPKNSCHKIIAHYLFYHKPNLYHQLTDTPLDLDTFLNIIQKKEPKYIERAKSLIKESFEKKTLDFCTKNGISIIEKTDKAYPQTFHYIESPPPLLFIKGNDALLNLILNA